MVKYKVDPHLCKDPSQRVKVDPHVCKDPEQGQHSCHQRCMCSNTMQWRGFELLTRAERGDALKDWANEAAYTNNQDYALKKEIGREIVT